MTKSADFDTLTSDKERYSIYRVIFKINKVLEFYLKELSEIPAIFLLPFSSLRKEEHLERPSSAQTHLKPV